MPKADSGASALASLLDGSTAGELIPELARHGLQQLIELEGRRMFSLDSMAAIPPSAEALPEPDRERGAMP